MLLPPLKESDIEREEDDKHHTKEEFYVFWFRSRRTWKRSHPKFPKKESSNEDERNEGALPEGIAAEAGGGHGGSIWDSGVAG